MTSLLELLASRQGTAPNVLQRIQDGASVEESHPKTKEGPLHVVLRRCVLPLELYNIFKVLVDHNVDVNARDHRGATPLSLLILHINHGLRYHSYPLPQIQRLEDLGASRQEMQETVSAIDASYQEQVYRSLELLINAGAEVNDVPGIVPAIPSNTAWVEAYEHKLMQQEGRWNLLGYDTSMEVSTYNIFNPLTSHRCINDLGITPLHLASWRGDARCIKILLDHGADVTAIAQDLKQKKSLTGFSMRPLHPVRQHCFKGNSECYDKGDGADFTGRRAQDGRGPLHFLYMYCNKPGDLVAATRHLVEAGASTNILHEGEAPCHALIPHVFVKRTYHQYLSACYFLHEIRLESSYDDYIGEIQTCLSLLKEGALQKSLQDSLILEAAKQFNRILVNTDVAFQDHGHYLVPYTYRLEPLTRFVIVLVENGAKVNICDIEGRTPLHHIVNSLRSLSLDPGLNPLSSLSSCFSTLLQGGADTNRKDMLGRSPVHMLHAVVMDSLGCVVMNSTSFSCYTEVLDLLLQHGGNLDLPDCEGKSLLTYALSKFSMILSTKALRGVLLSRYIELLILYGASVNNSHDKGFVECLICQHLIDHTIQAANVLHLDVPGPEVRVISMLCACLSQTMLQECINTCFKRIDSSNDDPPPIFERGFSQNCYLCSVLNSSHTTPATLKTGSRRAIRESLGNNYQRKVQTLPLPPPIIRYLLDLTLH